MVSYFLFLFYVDCQDEEAVKTLYPVIGHCCEKDTIGTKVRCGNVALLK